MRIRLIIPACIALGALLWLAGCDRGDVASFTSEADEAFYRQGQQLAKQGRTQEALSSYLKVIAKRGESAPESHLEAGLIYLQHIKDPIAAIYHFRKYLELQPNARQAQYVRGLVDNAKREFARTLPAQPLESQTERLDFIEQIDRVQRENEQLKTELTALRAGVPPPLTRSKFPIGDSTGDEQRSRPTNSAAQEFRSPITAAPLHPELAEPPPTVTIERPGSAKTNATAAANSGPTRPPTRPANTAPAGARKHTVQKGDTLFSIAKKYYGAGTNAKVQEVFAANRDVMKNPNAMPPIGTELKIP